MKKSRPRRKISGKGTPPKNASSKLSIPGNFSDLSDISEKACLVTPHRWVRVFAYAISFFPPYGFLLGIIYFSQPDEAARQFGRRCIIAAGVGTFALCLYWGTVGIIRGFSHPIPTDGLVGGYY